MDGKGRIVVLTESFTDVVKVKHAGKYKVYYITIPSEVIKKLGIEEGDRITITITKATITE